MRPPADFFQCFVGDWRVTDLPTGEEGTMTIRVGVAQFCHLLEIRISGIRRTELSGFDQATRNCTANGTRQFWLPSRLPTPTAFEAHETQ